MAEKNIKNIIPTSASTFEIVQSQYKELNDTIRYFSDYAIKSSDLANIKKSVKKSKKAVSLIVEGYKDVTSYIDKEGSLTKNVVFSIVSDPVLFVKSIKDKESFIDVKQKNELFILDSYIMIFKLLSQISKFGNTIKLKNIKKLPKVTRAAMSAVVSSLKIIGRRAKFIKPIAKATEVTITGLTNVFGSLLTMQGMLTDFGSKALSISKMVGIRWAIRQLFLSFVFVLVELYQLGKFLKTGEYDDESLRNVGIFRGGRKRKIQYSESGKDLITTLAMGAGVMVGATLVMFLMSLMIPHMKVIGTLKTKILLKATLRNLNELFFGWDKEIDPEGDDSKGKNDFHNNGLIDMMNKIGKDKDIWKTALNFAAVCTSITLGLILINITVKELRKIWLNSILLKPSLRTLNTLFFGKTRGKLGKKLGLNDTPGLIDIFEDAITDKNVDSVKRFMWMSFRLGIAMTVIQSFVIPSIAILAISRLPIKWGLKTLDILINGIQYDEKGNGRKGLLTIMRLATYGDKGKLNIKAVKRFMWMSFRLGAAMFVLQNTLIPALSLMAIAGIPMILGTQFLGFILLGSGDMSIPQSMGGGTTKIRGLIDIFTDEKFNEKGILKNGLMIIAICGMTFLSALILGSLAIFAPVLPFALLSILSIELAVWSMVKILTYLNEKSEDLKEGIKQLPNILIPFTTLIGLLKAAKDVTFKDIGIAAALSLVAPFITKGMIKVVKIASTIGASKAGIADLAVTAPAYIGFMTLLNKAGETYSAANFENSHKLVKNAQMIAFSMVRLFRRLGRRLGYKNAIMGSMALSMMSTSLLAFSESMSLVTVAIGKIDIKSIKRLVAFTAGLAAVLVVIGLASPLILVGVTALFAVSAAILVFAAAILVLNIALMAFAGVIIVFALAFSLLEKILPGNDVISSVVDGTIQLILAISRITSAIYQNISLKQVFFGVIALGVIDIILLELVIAGVLFKVAASIVSNITEDQTESILKFVDCLSDIVHGIYEKVNGKELIVALISCIGYAFLMVLLTFTALLTVIFYGIISIIDFKSFEKQLGINSDSGFIPSLGNIAKGIDENIDGIATIKAVLKIGGIMILVGMLNAVALAIKTLSSMEITEFDENGKATGSKVKMKASDFKDAADNATDMIKAVVGIFYDENGNETPIVKLLGTIDKSMKKQLNNVQAVVNTIGKIAKIISKMSKLVVPDPDKGFDKDGKALGWVAMTDTDIDNFKVNTLKLCSALFDIFDNSTENGKKLQSTLESVKASMVLKMAVIRNVIGSISNIVDVIVKMSTALVPDTSSGKNDWYDPETGKIIKWRQLNLSPGKNNDIGKAKGNIERLMSCFAEICSGLNDKNIKSLKKKTLKKANLALSMISPINSLIETIIKLSTGQFPMMILNEDGTPQVDENGNSKIFYQNFDQLNITGAINNISLIIEKYLAEIGGIFNTGWYKRRIKAINKTMKNGIAVEGISDLIDNIIKLATGQFPMMILNEDGTPVLDKDGNAKMKYVTLNSTLIQNAAQNIGTIIKSYIEELTKVTGTGLEAEIFKQKMTTLNSIFTGSESIFTILTPMIDNITKVSDIEDKKIDSFTKNMQNIVFGYNTAIISINDNIDNYKLWETVRDPFNDFVNTSSNLYSELKDNAIPTNIEKSVNSTNKFLAQVNGMNTNKLNKMADISGNMAKFSTSIRGNFDSLAKAMNENIITALDKVDKSLKELKDFLEDDFTNKLSTGVSDAVGNITVKTDGDKDQKSKSIVPHRNDVADKAPDNKTQRQATQQQNNNKENLNTLINDLLQCINGTKKISVTND